MRIGLVTDVHNHAQELAVALDQLAARGVDRIVTLGDTCDAFNRNDGAKMVTAMLAGVNATGVWGNHDFALCREVEDRHRERYPPSVLDFMATIEPRIVIGDAHFSHRESTADPEDVEQLWNLAGGVRNLEERAAASFEAVDQAWQFVGHYHQWWATSDTGPIEWSGDEPLDLEPGRRYWVVIAAVCEGNCAILDTEARRLEPLAFTAE